MLGVEQELVGDETAGGVAVGILAVNPHVAWQADARRVVGVALGKPGGQLHVVHLVEFEHLTGHQGGVGGEGPESVGVGHAYGGRLALLQSNVLGGEHVLWRILHLAEGAGFADVGSRDFLQGNVAEVHLALVSPTAVELLGEMVPCRYLSAFGGDHDQQGEGDDEYFAHDG